MILAWKTLFSEIICIKNAQYLAMKKKFYHRKFNKKKKRIPLRIFNIAASFNSKTKDFQFFSTLILFKIAVCPPPSEKTKQGLQSRKRNQEVPFG